ncbi:hypothetical protein MTO96_017017 [Rhipicephalus appendiculatus]
MSSSSEWTALHILLTCLGNFTMAVLCAAVFSYTTRFISLLAAKASVVKRLHVNALLFGLLVTNVVVLLAACFACLHEVIAGLKVCPWTQRQKYFAWYLQLPVDMVRGPTLMAAVVLAPSLVLLMKTDVAATFRTYALHRRETKEARELFNKRWVDPLKRELKNAFIMIICMFVFFGIISILALIKKEARARQAAPAASDDM